MWTDEGRSEYETLVSQNARSLCDYWYDPSSPALTTVLLTTTNALYNMAALKTNKILKGKNKSACMVSVPSPIKKAKDKLRKAHSKLCYIRANPFYSASALNTAERKYHDLNMNYKNVVRKNRARSAIIRDLRINQTNDVFRYVRALRNAPSSKVRKLNVGQQVYMENMVADGLYRSMASVKSCDIEALRKSQHLADTFVSYDHIIELCKEGSGIPPVTIETARNLLLRL